MILDRQADRNPKMREREEEPSVRSTATTPTASSSRRLPPFPRDSSSAPHQYPYPAPHSDDTRRETPLDVEEPLEHEDPLENKESPTDRRVSRFQSAGNRLRSGGGERSYYGGSSKGTIEYEEEAEEDSGRWEPQRTGSLAMMDPLEEYDDSDEELDNRGGSPEINEAQTSEARERRQVCDQWRQRRLYPFKPLTILGPVFRKPTS